MQHIGAFDAKNRLSELLERVQHGEVILITKHGRPVARLGPVDEHDRGRSSDAVQRLRQLRARQPATGAEIRTWIDHGRRG